MSKRDYMKWRIPANNPNYIIRNDMQNYYILIICIVQYYTSARATVPLI